VGEGEGEGVAEVWMVGSWGEGEADWVMGRREAGWIAVVDF